MAVIITPRGGCPSKTPRMCTAWTARDPHPSGSSGPDLRLFNLLSARAAARSTRCCDSACRRLQRVPSPVHTSASGRSPQCAHRGSSIRGRVASHLLLASLQATERNHTAVLHTVLAAECAVYAELVVCSVPGRVVLAWVLFAGLLACCCGIL